MEIADEFENDIVLGENINYVYLKNEVSKLINYKLPDNLDS